MPTAGRIQKDPSRGARKSPSDTADLDFRAVSPALHILQLNVEELPAAKRVVIQSSNTRYLSFRKLTLTLPLLTALQYQGFMSYVIHYMPNMAG